MKKKKKKKKEYEEHNPTGEAVEIPLSEIMQKQRRHNITIFLFNTLILRLRVNPWLILQDASPVKCRLWLHFALPHHKKNKQSQP